MHFRVRKHVVQFVRMTYEPGIKKGRASVVGSVKLSNLELTEELRLLLTPKEFAEYEQWRKTHFRIDILKSELAALALPEQIMLTQSWFERNRDHETAQFAAREIIFRWQELRKVLRKQELLD